MRELEKLLHSDVSEDRHYRNELKYVCSEGELQLILAKNTPHLSFGFSCVGNRDIQHPKHLL